MNKNLNKIVEEYICDFKQKKKYDFVVKPSIPIVWFGDMEGYISSSQKVVTVGLNPSLKEFSEKRFHIDSDNFSAEDLYFSLNNYFKVNPYRKYFSCFDKILETFSATYNVTVGEKNTAIHIDVFTSIATKPTWGKLTEIQQNRVNQFALFEKLLEYLAPDVVIISLARQVVRDIFDLSTHCLIYRKEFSVGPEIEVYQKNNKIIVYGRNRTGCPFAVKTEIIMDAKKFLSDRRNTYEKLSF